MTITDAEAWDLGVRTLLAEFESLDPQIRNEVWALCGEVVSLKKALHAQLPPDSGETCRRCAGECCRSGRYHVTAVEILCCRIGAGSLFHPRFGAGSCPYLGVAGCVMGPGERPFACITFNCERIVELLDDMLLGRLYHLEREIRGRYLLLERYFHPRLFGGILGFGEAVAEGKQIFRGKA